MVGCPELNPGNFDEQFPYLLGTSPGTSPAHMRGLCNLFQFFSAKDWDQYQLRGHNSVVTVHSDNGL